MAKNEPNLKASEDFIAAVMKKRFNKVVSAEELRTAAAKLCDAVPERVPELA